MNHNDEIPLLNKADEAKINQEQLPVTLPILPLKNMVLMPGVVMPITVGREKSIALINDVYQGNKILGIVAQQQPDVEHPAFDDLYTVGTMAEILRVMKMPDGTTTTIIQGRKAFQVKQGLQTEPYLLAEIQAYDDIQAPDTEEFRILIDEIKTKAIEIIKISPHIPNEAVNGIQNIDSSTFLINFIASNMNANHQDKQSILELFNVEDRAKAVYTHLVKELNALHVRSEIQGKVKSELDQQQREFLLHQQLKAIQQELGGNTTDKLIKDFQKRGEDKKWNDATALVFAKELKKLERLNPNSPEYGVQTNYLEVLLEIPFNEYTDDNFDLHRAEEILDRDHTGLQKVKERILEYLAVLKLKNDMKSPILCLYGPPGVGKTSLGKSIAEALGRSYVRMALGGLRDEAEIRGHRKTYIGAMPGRIIQNIKKAQSANPVFILDEIDKLGADFRGDPSSALLEVLDPEQNSTFYDNYLELDFDLSKVMFIATANNISNIQGPLLDRMEMIEVTGYTVHEKIGIAVRHLLPKQLKEHGVESNTFHITEEALARIVNEYTRESGVRTLDKRLAKVVRYVAKNIVMETPYIKEITADTIPDILGVPLITREKQDLVDHVGVVTGLAWTAVGGEVLHIETSLAKGESGITVTGNLGQVMKESATLALGYIKTNADVLGVDVQKFKDYGIYLHVPAGAVPKDGPSAGITIFTALMSSFLGCAVRHNVAMTGEITLRGLVMPVGGIKEKILAAKREGKDTIILCEANQKDVLDIDAQYLEGLSFHYIKEMKEVLDLTIIRH